MRIEEFKMERENLVKEGEKVAAEATAVTEVTGPVQRAPMGGKIIEIMVKPGDRVSMGDVLLVYEAMKMENDLTSDIEGVVKQILVREDDVIGTDQMLIEFEG